MTVTHNRNTRIVAGSVFTRTVLTAIMSIAVLVSSVAYIPPAESAELLYSNKRVTNRHYVYGQRLDLDCVEVKNYYTWLGAPIVQYPCQYGSGHANQRWDVVFHYWMWNPTVKRWQRAVEFRNRNSGMCMAIRYSGSRDIVQRPCTGSGFNDEMWQVENRPQATVARETARAFINMTNNQCARVPDDDRVFGQLFTWYCDGLWSPYYAEAFHVEGWW